MLLWQQRAGKLNQYPSFSFPLDREPEFAARLRARSQSAALLLAAALDTYLPELTTFSEPWKRGQQAASCDAVDAAPVLCVGSNADNRHEKNASLLIDLGGNDVYRNSAGASFTEGGNTFVASSVNVDLAGGNDRYEADPKIATGFNIQGDGVLEDEIHVAAQGAGVSGVGILVDDGGKDVYSVPPPQTTVARPKAMITAQGAGGIGGNGFLFDEGGSDSYLVAGLNGQENSSTGYAQASAALSSNAALVDSGVGDDTYTYDLGSITQTLDNPNIRASRSGAAQAYAGINGHAVLSDTGGRDHFELIGRSEFVPSIDDYSRVTPPILGLSGQAAAITLEDAMAFLLEGSGPTTYKTSTEEWGPVQTGFKVQAVAYGLGNPLTAIDDQDGDDNYVVTAQNDFHRIFTQTDACLCDAAEAVVDTLWAEFNHSLWAQGIAISASGNADSLLNDKAGSDTYAFEFTSDQSFALNDKLTKPTLPPLMRVWGTQITIFYAQGNLSPTFGEGNVVDHGLGKDTYDVTTTTRLKSEITSARWRGNPDLKSYLFPSLAYGQVILDEGGEGDLIRMVATADHQTLPDPDDSIEFSSNLWPVGASTAYAGGTDPVILSTTSAPSCGDPGYKGFGRYGLCESNPEDPDHDRVANGGGTGWAPNAVGAKPDLQLLPPLPESVRADPRGDTRVPVSAKLTDPSGKPMAGIPLHFDLVASGTQRSPTGNDVRLGWGPVFQETAVTNKKGIAKARLPLLLLLREGDDLIPDPEVTFGIFATYDGSDDFYPRHAVHVIDVLPPGPGEVARRGGR